MIFTNISSIKTKDESAFFDELISLFVRFVDLFKERNLVVDGAVEDEELISELKSIGVIKDDSELPLLKSHLKDDYPIFIESVCCAINNRDSMGGMLDKLYNSKRRDFQTKDLKTDKPTLVDFFCGAGGLSLGFIQNGFRVVLANDIEDVCINTYKYNHPEISSDRIIQGDIRGIVDRIEDYVKEEVDVVVGGPPCQGFSEANRQRLIDDPRNHLYKYYVKAISKLCPKVFLMENVKGMLKVANQVVEDFESLQIEKGGKVYSYKVAYKILNSKDFSVAQARERLIYLGIRNDLKNTSPVNLFELIASSCLKNPEYALSEALKEIKPLEAPRVKGVTEIDSDVTGKKIDYNDYHSNKYLDLINNGRRIPLVYNHKARFVSDLNYEIYRKLDQGEDSTVEKIADIMPYAHRNHCFKDKYYKLVADKPCRTITAHLKMDCHSHIHPYQVRSITPREAARVQSFPDDYFFLGAYLKTYMQIGNAVPVVMARKIAKIIMEVLKK